MAPPTRHSPCSMAFSAPESLFRERRSTNEKRSGSGLGKRNGRKALLKFCMKIGTPLLALLSLIGPSIAQSGSCDGNTQEMVDCLARSLKTVDAELNTEYQKALKVTKDQYHRSADVQNLKDAQRKWIAYRDAVCKAEYGLVGGGTAGPSIHISCLIRITKQRIADLEAEY